jgi:hypothetical protein
LLEGEGRSDLTEEEAAEVEKEMREKYGRRKLGTNVDRYKEEEIELDSDGMSLLNCRSSLHILVFVQENLSSSRRSICRPSSRNNASQTMSVPPLT